MPNPARALLEIFTQWDARPGVAAAQVSAETNRGWSEIRRAVGLLDDMAASFDLLEMRGVAVDAYRSHLPAWRASVFHYDRDWTGRRLSLRDEDALHLAVAMLDLAGLPDVRATCPADIDGLLDQIQKTVTRDSSLDRALRDYILRLVSHLRYLLSLDEGGLDAELHEQMGHLKFCMDAAAHQSQDSGKRRWYHGVAQYFVAPYASAVLTELTTGPAIHALTAGAGG